MDDTQTQLLPDNPFSPPDLYELALRNAILQPWLDNRPQPDRDVTPLMRIPEDWPSAYPGGRGRYLAPADTDLSHPPYTPPGGQYYGGAEAGPLGTKPEPVWIPGPIPVPRMDTSPPQPLNIKATMDDSTSPAAPVAAPQTDAAAPVPGSLDTGGDSISPVMRQFLDGVAGPESGGRYNIRYGGSEGPQIFNGYDVHPNLVSKIPGTDQTSTAAGKYQFLNSTWAPIAAQLGLKDFSPENQDRGAAYLATSTYKRVTGRDLEADLQDPARHSSIATTLHSQWPTLTGKNISLALGAAPAAPSARPPPAMVASAPEAPAAAVDPFTQLRALNRLQALTQMTQPQQGKVAASGYNPGGATAAILQAGNIGQATNPLQTLMQLARLKNPLSYYG